MARTRFLSYYDPDVLPVRLSVRAFPDARIVPRPYPSTGRTNREQYRRVSISRPV